MNEMCCLRCAYGTRYSHSSWCPEAARVQAEMDYLEAEAAKAMLACDETATNSGMRLVESNDSGTVLTFFDPEKWKHLNIEESAPFTEEQYEKLRKMKPMGLPHLSSDGWNPK